MAVVKEKDAEAVRPLKTIPQTASERFAPKSLEHEIVLVTGGANGIGREICIQLATLEKNLTIITWDVNEEKNLETVDILRGLGVRKALAYTVDVSSQEEVALAAAKVRKDAGDVSILFNNAGIDPKNTIGWKKDPQTIKKVFDVNILSHVWTFREFLPQMIQNRRGFVLTNMTAHMDFRMRRYTFLNEVSTPDFVASRIVHGMRHRKQHIYVPQLNIAMRFLIELLPEEVVAKLFDFAGAPWIPVNEPEDCQTVVVHKF
ncbi:unnamed protein product [Allacma fusca]|uniref:Uncharacterized protein n=1 Tax=Allacma fusca TaxID=39272 RepID=A0A8J2L697_9HEXA|nr:unnamed protein product [Allacma fusca]